MTEPLSDERLAEIRAGLEGLANAPFKAWPRIAPQTLLALLSRLDKAEAGWQDISTAPKDGGAVDLWANGERYADCVWMRPTKRAGFMAWCRYSYDDAYGPVYNEVVGATHFRPLPPPPSSES